jgi:hypothetical protein
MMMKIDPRWELKILGEESMGVLVETPDGEEVMLERERMTNYVRVDMKLIPKDKVDWL